MLIRRVLRKLLSQKGQSMVEVGLITPLVLIALMVPIDFALMFMVAKHTQNSVREVARIAAAQSTYNDSAMEADLTARLSSYTVTSNSVTLRKTGAAGCTQTISATATVAYPFFFYRMMNWFGFNISMTKNITRTTEMRYEFQPSTNGGASCAA